MVKGFTMKNSACLITGMAALLLLVYSLASEAQVYKVVDAEGNVTYTDQAPSDGSQPMKLPELSVVDTDYEAPPPADSSTTAGTEGDGAPSEPTPREMRKMYSDFTITRPAPEETFWGTANQVVVSWASANPFQPGMTVRLFVDGQLQPGDGEDMRALTLDRGEHTVYAELLDARGRRVATTASVTFFVKQHSVGFNRPEAVPIARN